MAAIAMTQASRPNLISSVDQLFELVEGLDEAQIQSLLQDFNNTVVSNVPVSHGVDLFEHPKPRSTPVRVLSIRRFTLKTPRIFNRSNKGQTPAPALLSRPRTALPTSARHYRRISRPVLPTLPSGPDLDALLSAYLARLPPKSPSNTSSPSSTRSISASSSLSVEADDTHMDSLAPLVFGRPQRQNSNMGDIFEVLEY
ncbi:hypothetical protein BGZ61DRAFT_470176 [Ilyonectria robusta]|uniref:uncharacterized protein n=1 Tax=Ilyonectria robusta TaxID=1079257 RepID=UPI001E8D0E63|nr:uncharacterized protein BGZ61DRAFT_470176 [Ilyonectria robusta]KAH8645378.1 hypothetical protein BGZ61DRAFT_470176 [Ilyonectria robusta]